MSLSGEVFICAGEYSGDLLAADLAVALRHTDPQLRLFGVTGAAMQQAGVETLASITALSVMGIVEVASKLASLRMLERALLAEIDRRAPIAAILVDFPGFHFRLAEQLKLRGIPVYQYIAPKLWAWGESRMARLRSDFELVLGVFPFEEEYFRKHKVPFVYVGSPHLDRTDKVRVKRRDLSFSDKAPLVAFLPGSRMSEIRKILPLVLKIKEGLTQLYPNVQLVVPVALNLDFAAVEAALVALAGPQFDQKGIVLTRGMSLEIMAVADVCCVGSGTATLECALLGTPMVVVYIMNELSYLLATRKVKIPRISLVNILLQKGVVSEYIQDFSSGDLVEEIILLLQDGKARQVMQAEFAHLKSLLTGQAASNAAEHIVASLMTKKRPAP